MVNYGYHSRFPDMWCLNQYHNWYLQDSSLPLQYYPALDMHRVNNEGTYYHQQNTNSIQWPLLGGKAAGLCVESQHGHNFSPSYISCWDESMVRWVNKHICLGFIFVPHKPWPSGNEWHNIACSNSSILFCVEYFEGKDAAIEPPSPPKYSGRVKIVSLMLCLTRILGGGGGVLLVHPYLQNIKHKIKY